MKKNQNNEVSKRFQELQKQNRKLWKEKDFYRTQLCRSENGLLKFKPSKHYKCYRKVTSYSMHRKQSLQCCNILSNVFANLTDVKRARVTLGMCNDNANFIWSEGEIAHLQASSKATFHNNCNPLDVEDPNVDNEDNQTVSSQSFEADFQESNADNIVINENDIFQGSANDCDDDVDVDDFDDEPDPDPSENEIFDTDGNWNKKFLCQIITVMDKYKISHDAFHELRMVCLGYLPSINRIKSEKSKLSTEVKYTKDQSVSYFKYIIY